MPGSDPGKGQKKMPALNRNCGSSAEIYLHCADQKGFRKTVSPDFDSLIGLQNGIRWWPALISDTAVSQLFNHQLLIRPVS
jgi:hypothetical protein